MCLGALALLVVGVGGYAAFRFIGFRVYYIPSEAMEPTLMGHDAGQNPLTGATYSSEIHDHILVDRLVYRFTEPKRGDIIVFLAEKKADKSALMQGRAPQEIVLVKRVIGIPGDTIELKRDSEGVMRVFRNGRPLKEPYAEKDGSCKGPSYCIKEPLMDPQSPVADFAVQEPFKLGPDEVFVMGDNRNNSNDSRFWGPLPRNRVIGKVVSIIMPEERQRSFP